MDDTGNRAVRSVADRIGTLFRHEREFGHVGHELPRNRVVRIVPVDQARDRRADGDGVAGRDPGDRLFLLSTDQTGVGELTRCSDGAFRGHGVASATGAQRT